MQQILFWITPRIQYHHISTTEEQRKWLYNVVLYHRKFASTEFLPTSPWLVDTSGLDIRIKCLIHVVSIRKILKESFLFKQPTDIVWNLYNSPSWKFLHCLCPYLLLVQCLWFFEIFTTPRSWYSTNIVVQTCHLLHWQKHTSIIHYIDKCAGSKQFERLRIHKLKQQMISIRSCSGSHSTLLYIYTRTHTFTILRNKEVKMISNEWRMTMTMTMIMIIYMYRDGELALTSMAGSFFVLMHPSCFLSCS